MYNFAHTSEKQIIDYLMQKLIQTEIKVLWLEKD